MKVLVFLFLGLVSSLSFAEETSTVKYSDNYSCQQVQSAVQASGRALIYSKSNFGTGVTYDLVHAIGCPSMTLGYTSSPFWVNTKDQKDCFVGYTCVVSDTNNGNNH